MTILLLGAKGQLGWELGAGLATLGPVIAFDRQGADLSRPDDLEDLVRRINPQIIVNSAAYTQVDQAEAEVQMARLVNAQAPSLLARLAKELGAWLVHYSTDYVFDGTKDGLYTEEDRPAPLSEYGRGKLAGDLAIIDSGCQHLIFRTSWVYSALGRNFPKTILGLAQKEERLSVVDDQEGSPTGVEFLANATVLALSQALKSGDKLSGLYNLTPSGSVTWHGLTLYLLEKARSLGWNLTTKPENVGRASSQNSTRPARRPANSRLDCTKFSRTFGLATPPWEYHLDRLVATLTQAGPEIIK